MKRPENWESTQAAIPGDFKNIAPGGYVAKIRQARIETTKTTGKEVMVIAFDIAEGEYKDFFQEQYSKRKESNPDAKWLGIFRQLTEGNSLRFFKGMITSIEESNNGYSWNWDEKTLAGKLIGVVMGEEEYEGNDGEIKVSCKCQQFRSIKSIREGVEPPKIKKLKGTTTSSSVDEDFMPINDEDLPF